MYAQLFYISEEGNHYPKTDRVFISDSLVDLLTVPKEHEGNEAYWRYTNQSQKQSDLTGGWHPTDNNINC